MRTKFVFGVMVLFATVLLCGPVVWSSERIAMKAGQGEPMGMMGEHMDMAGKWSMMRPDGRAPIGVMGDHMPMKGKWMFQYQYMRMEMDGNRDGTDSLRTREVLEDFPVAPTEMTMQMHMFGIMYAPLNRLSLMVMAPYIRNEMDHETRTGVKFNTTSRGWGDVKLTALIHLYEIGRHRFHLNAGISFPTGSINQKDDLPTGPDQRLPYPMQLGSGTYDLLPGITYLGQTDNWSWGTQFMGTIRLGENNNDYTLGDRFKGTGWLAHKWFDWLSSAIRIEGQDWGNIDGEDPRLNPNLVPTADPNRRAGSRVDLLFSTNVFMRKGFLKGNRLGIEGGIPIYQDLDGPQLETDWLIWAGWQYMF